MIKDIKAVIMAGGKGTRISSIVDDVPKPMIDICGKPLLERQMEWLISQNTKEVILVIGHMGDKIVNYFGSGEKIGISIKYITEEEPLGTAGGLYYLRSEDNLPFLIINGDLMLDIDINRMYQFHKAYNCDITLLTHPNSHPYDSSLIEVNEDSRVVQWINKEDPRLDYKNRVNAGIHLIEQTVFAFMDKYNKPVKLDLDRDIIKPNIGNYKIFAYDSPEYVKDMGTPERYYAVCQDFKNGKIKQRNLGRSQKAIFIDRDGTVNRLKDFITNPDEVELLPGAAEAIKMINGSEYLAILITNQPVIARGDCTIDELKQIHNRLERLLGEGQAYLDDIFFCPHHPDRGFKGERPEYKIDCACRKPKPGLLYEAAARYNIDLGKSYMIGDSIGDVFAGQNAGCKTGFIGTEERSKELDPDFIGNNLKELVERILYDNH